MKANEGQVKQANHRDFISNTRNHIKNTNADFPAFATPPVLRLLLLLIALLLASVEAVAVPNVKATLFDTNPRLDVADDISELELDVVDMCKFLAAGVQPCTTFDADSDTTQAIEDRTIDELTILFDIL